MLFKRAKREEMPYIHLWQKGDYLPESNYIIKDEMGIFKQVNQDDYCYFGNYPVGILNDYKNTSESQGYIKDCIKAINTVFKAYGIGAYAVGESIGMTQIRFEIALNQSTRVNEIYRLKSELQMRLRVDNLSVEKIPQKEALGIVIPRQNKAIVGLKEILKDWRYNRIDEKKLKICLGVDLDNNPVLVDLAEFPHLLIAGSTGGGKSVLLNSIITQLIYNYTPEYSRLVLVDFKRVEFTPYNQLPHLLKPIITEQNAAESALNEIKTEINNRNEKMAEAGVKNIAEFNSKSGNLPYIVFIIDEYAQLTGIDDFISSVIELARAAGVHFILSTQTPKKEIITTRIKNNLPAKIALKCGNEVSSRLILDESGAENLSGKGDMILKWNQTEHLQGIFLDTDEIERICGYLKQNYKSDHRNNFDSLTGPALKLFENQGYGSKTSLINHYGIGGPRALKIIRQLQDTGAIGETTESGNKLLKSYDEVRDVFEQV